MAHHNSTPQAILDAPEFRPQFLVEHVGLPRRARRHIRDDNGRIWNIPKWMQPKASNSPVVALMKEDE